MSVKFAPTDRARHFHRCPWGQVVKDRAVVQLLNAHALHASEMAYLLPDSLNRDPRAIEGLLVLRSEFAQIADEQRQADDAARKADRGR